MKILVAGATGLTGLRLVKQLRDKGHTPIALVREGSDTDNLPKGTQTRHGDLTDLADGVCDGVDAVIFAAGSGSDTGAEMTEAVDRDGARRLVDLAVKAGVRRFVMLSTVGADNPDPDGKLGHYLQAKHEADEHLKASGLPYVILRPVALTKEDGTREMRFGDDVNPRGKAARGDVAAMLADAVDNDEWLGKAFLMESA